MGAGWGGPEVRPCPVLSLLVPSGHSPSPWPHSAWHMLPCSVKGLQGQVTVARTLGLRHAAEGQERAIRPCGAPPPLGGVSLPLAASSLFHTTYSSCPHGS